MRRPHERPAPGAEPSGELDDLALVERCLRGQPAAWQLLVERLAPAVSEAARYTLRRVLGRARAEDVENIVQSVFLGLCDRHFRRLRLYQGRASLRTWITAVTTRFALNYIRTEKRKGSLKLAPLDESAPEPPAREGPDSLSPDDRDLLHRGLEKLSARERLLLKLCYFDELSYREVALALQVPVNSVSPMLARARENLRNLLRP